MSMLEQKKKKAIPCLRNDMQKEGRNKENLDLVEKIATQKENGTGMTIIIITLKVLCNRLSINLLKTVLRN